MKKPTIKDLVEYMILESYTGVLKYQRLIDKWNDPKDVMQGVAVTLRDVHEMYGKFASIIYLDLVKK